MLIITRMTGKTTDKLFGSIQPYFGQIFESFRKMNWIKNEEYEKKVMRNYKQCFVEIYDDLFLQITNSSSCDEVISYLQQLYFDVTGKEYDGIVNYAVFPAKEFDWGFDTLISLFYPNRDGHDVKKQSALNRPEKRRIQKEGHDRLRESC